MPVDENLTTKRDMELLRTAADFIRDPARLPFRFTAGGETFTGIPAEYIREKKVCYADANLRRMEIKARVSRLHLDIAVEQTEYLDFPVVETLVTLTNSGDKNSAVLTDVYAADLVLPCENPILYRNTGDYCSIDGLETFKEPLSGEQTVITPKGGRSCDSALPYFRVIGKNFGYNLAIGWPGQWQAEFSLSGGGIRCESFRFAAKQQYTGFYLKPGETARLPRVTLSAFYGGELRAANIWRRWYFAHILPRVDGKSVPPMCNLAYTASSDPGDEFTQTTEENQLWAISTLAARGARPDIWWIDAGWYPCKDDDGIRRWWRTGNFTPDPERYPRGLSPVGRLCREKGIRLLLWFEPERIVFAYQAKDLPDRFILHRTLRDQNGEEKEADTGLLNLGDPECLRWLIEKTDKTIKDAGISIYRQDFNMEALDYWLQNDGPDRLGMTENLHIQGYLAYWDALRERNPDLLIDSCASGGRRNDLETMRRAIALHPTDYGYGHHPVKQLFYKAMTEWTPYFRAFPLSWDDENGEYNTKKPPARGTDSFGLHSGIGPACSGALSPDMDEKQFAFVNSFIEHIWRSAAKDMLAGDFYPLTPVRKSNRDWYADQFHVFSGNRGHIHVIRNTLAEAESLTVFPHALDENTVYRFVSPEFGKSFEKSGAEIKKDGLTFTLPKRAAELWFYEAVK